MIRYWAFERTVRLSPVFMFISSYHHTVAFEENSPPWKFNHMIKCSSSTENMHLICFRLLLREKLSSCAQAKRIFNGVLVEMFTPQANQWNTVHQTKQPGSAEITARFCFCFLILPMDKKLYTTIVIDLMRVI